MKRALEESDSSSLKRAKYEGAHQLLISTLERGRNIVGSLYRNTFPFFPVVYNFHLYKKSKATGSSGLQDYRKMIEESFSEFISQKKKYKSCTYTRLFKEYLKGDDDEKLASIINCLDEENPRSLRSFYKFLNSKNWQSAIEIHYNLLASTWKQRRADYDFFEFYLLSFLFSLDKEGNFKPLFPELEEFRIEDNPLIEEMKALMKGKNHQLIVLLLLAYLSSFRDTTSPNLIFAPLDDSIFTQFAQIEQRGFDNPENWKVMVDCLRTLLSFLVSTIE